VSRARELGLAFGHFPPGADNAITDVPGVRVGHATILEGETRTGVTAVLPSGDVFARPLPAGGFVLNGAGELTGLTQVLEWGRLETPILLTNTHAVGTCADAVVRALLARHPEIGRSLDVVIPVVGECDDSWLNDASIPAVTAAHVEEALAAAAAGPVAEGSVGGGAGMVCCDFKGGIGTSSRRLESGEHLGALVMTNFGLRRDLRLGGYPVGAWLEERCREWPRRKQDYGSIIVVVATDAPLSSGQLSRVSRRAALGVGRAGSYAAHGSGEIVIAFSTANARDRADAARVVEVQAISDAHVDPFYEAAAEATEEAIANALCAARDMVGARGHEIRALPLDEIRGWLARHPA
jgi:D-aminopeptidase